LYYVGRQQLDDDPYRTESADYVLAGVLVMQRVGRAQLFVNLENLGDVRQTRWAPLVRPAYDERRGWTTDAWAPLEGRVVNGGVRWRF
jgi:iron complex outermembrane receptor protein